MKKAEREAQTQRTAQITAEKAAKKAKDVLALPAEALLGNHSPLLDAASQSLQESMKDFLSFLEFTVDFLPEQIETLLRNRITSIAHLQDIDEVSLRNMGFMPFESARLKRCLKIRMGV